MLVAKTYPILLNAVEEGAIRAVNRAQKYYDIDFPADTMAGLIVDCIMESILESFDIMESTES